MDIVGSISAANRNRSVFMARSGKDSEWQIPDRIPIEYVDSRDFKSAFVVGARGGVENNVLHATFYSEGPPTPSASKRVVAQEEDGLRIGPTDIFEWTEDDFKITRRMEFECHLTQPALQSIFLWLKGKLDQMEPAQPASASISDD